MSAGPSRPPEAQSVPCLNRVQKLFAVRLRNCTAAAVRSRTAAICALFPGTPVIPGGAGNAGGFDFWGLLCGQGGTVAGNAPWRGSLASDLPMRGPGRGAGLRRSAFFRAGHRLFAQACFRPWRNASAQGLRREEGETAAALAAKRS